MTFVQNYLASLRTIERVAAAAVMAAAAVLVLLFFSPVRDRFFPPRALDKLVHAVETWTHRPIDGRLTGGFRYKPFAPDGDFPEATPAPLLQAAGEIQNAGPRTADTLHSLAVSHLLLGRTDAAITALERGLARAGDDRELANELTNDLAAALLARGTQRDRERALELADRAWNAGRSTESAWNRAVAAEALGRRELAIRNWDAYLRIDRRSDWAKEARERRAALGGAHQVRELPTPSS